MENKQKNRKDVNTNHKEKNNKQKDKDIKNNEGKGLRKTSKTDEVSDDENEGNNTNLFYNTPICYLTLYITVCCS